MFLTDIFNPCWIFAAAPLGGARRIAIDVGQVPFNFQVGKDVEGITFRPPATSDGEFEVRAPGCDGERIAVLPLGPARANPGVTRLVAPIAPRAGTADLCITYTATGVNPMWAVDGVELLDPMTDIVLVAPFAGWLTPLDEVPDPVFAERMMGDGVAIDPVEPVLRAPADATVIAIPETAHAATLRLANGAELLIHIGLETVALGGTGFRALKLGRGRSEGRRPADRDRPRCGGPRRAEPGHADRRRQCRFRARARAAVAQRRPRRADRDRARCCRSIGRSRRSGLRTDRADRCRPRAARPPSGADRRAAAAVRGRRQPRRRGPQRQRAESRRACSASASAAATSVRIVGRGADRAAAVDAVAELIAGGVGEAPATEAAVPALRAGGGPVTASPGLAVGTVVQLRLADLPVARDGAGVAEERRRLAQALEAVAGSLIETDLVAAELAAAHRELLGDPDLIARANSEIARGAQRGLRLAQRLRGRARSDPRDRRPAADRARRRPHGPRAAGDRRARRRSPGRRARPSARDDPDRAGPAAVAAAGDRRVAPRRHLHGATAGRPRMSRSSPRRRASRCSSRRARTCFEIADGTTVDPRRRRSAGSTARPVARAAGRGPGAGRGPAQAPRAPRPATRASCASPPTASGSRCSPISARSSDAPAAVAAGAEGCGLLRTEFLFLDRATPPGQGRAAARSIARSRRARRAAADRPHARHRRRQARALSRHRAARTIPRSACAASARASPGPTCSRPSSRAIVAAVPPAQCRIMLPMITEVDELRQVRGLLDGAAQAAGLNERVALGVMIETPAAAVLADLDRRRGRLPVGRHQRPHPICRSPMDRGNAAVAARPMRLHPAVLRLIAPRGRGRAQARQMDRGVRRARLGSDRRADPDRPRRHRAVGRDRGGRRRSRPRFATSSWPTAGHWPSARARQPRRMRCATVAAEALGMKLHVEKLQPLGRALMLPIAVLPIAGAAAPARPAGPARHRRSSPRPAMRSSPISGCCSPSASAVGLARDNNGAAALAGVVGYLVVTEAAKALLRLPPDVAAA